MIVTFYVGASYSSGMGGQCFLEFLSRPSALPPATLYGLNFPPMSPSSASPSFPAGFVGCCIQHPKIEAVVLQGKRVNDGGHSVLRAQQQVPLNRQHLCVVRSHTVL